MLMYDWLSPMPFAPACMVPRVSYETTQEKLLFEFQRR